MFLYIKIHVIEQQYDISTWKLYSKIYFLNFKNTPT